MGIRVFFLAWAAVCVACAPAVVAPPTTFIDNAPRGPTIHTVFSETAGSNVTQWELRTDDVEVWPRDSGGAAIYGAAVLEGGQACHPSVLLMLDQPASPGIRQLGGVTSLRFEEDCADGAVRSWTAVAGELRFELDPSGAYRMQIVDAEMMPSAGEAVGRFKAAGTGLVSTR